MFLQTLCTLVLYYDVTDNSYIKPVLNEYSGYNLFKKVHYLTKYSVLMLLCLVLMYLLFCLCKCEVSSIAASSPHGVSHPTPYRTNKSHLRCFSPGVYRYDSHHGYGEKTVARRLVSRKDMKTNCCTV